MTKASSYIYEVPEMAELMNRVQQLVEGRVVFMVVQHLDGRYGLEFPPGREAEVLTILRNVDWSQVG